MPVGLLTIELQIPDAHSLKDKRQIVRSLKDRLRRQLNVAVSESGHHDKWQRATLCVVTVSNDAAVVHSILSQAEQMVQRELRIQLLDVRTELREKLNN